MATGDNKLAIETKEELEAELAKLAVNCDEAGWVTAQRVADAARGRAVRDTGSMADSCYASSSGGRSTYADSVSRAIGDNPRVIILDEEAPYQGDRPNEQQMFQGIAESLAAVAAKHGFFVENGYGPEGRRTPQPFFEQAAAQAEDWYMEELER